MERKIKQSFTSLTLLLILGLVGCDSNDPSDFSPGTPSTNESSFGEPTIPETTLVLPDSSLQLLESVSADTSTLIFSGQDRIISKLDLGDIIIAGVSEKTPEGLLRKITGSSGTSFETVQASMEEAFENLEMDVRRDLTTADIQSSALKTTHHGGAVLQEGFFVSVQDLVVYDHDGDRSTEVDQVRFNGSLDVDPGIYFMTDIDRHSLEFFEFGTYFDIDSNLSITSGVNGEIEIANVELASWPLNPIVFTVLFIPVVITPSLTLELNVNGRAGADITTGISFGLSSNIGMKFENGNWSGVGNTRDVDPARFSHTPPTAQVEAALKVAAGPKYTTKFYGLAGPYVGADFYLELLASAPPNSSLELFAGIDVNAGIRAQVFSRGMTGYELPNIFDRRFLLTSSVDRGTISGSVIDAVNSNPISDVQVRILLNDLLVGETTSSSAGEYSLNVSEGNAYTLDFSHPNYQMARYNEVDVISEQTTFLETILQINQNYSGQGQVSGSVLNALDGQGVGGLQIDLREGINTRNGQILRTSQTGVSGNYQFSSLESGQYTAHVTGSGYSSAYFTITCIGGMESPNQNGTVTPILGDNEIRIILTWGQEPRDLDSHFTGPLPSGQRFHINWRDFEELPYAVLDRDDTSSFGPETVTLLNQIEGVYRYSVHNYSDQNSSTSSRLSNSGAVVRIFRGNQLVQTFNVPSNRAGTLWTVFEYSSGQLTPINRISFDTQVETQRDTHFPNDQKVVVEMNGSYPKLKREELR